MITKHGWIITRGVNLIPQCLFGNSYNKLRDADDLLRVSVFEDPTAAIHSLNRVPEKEGRNFQVKRTQITMEILDT